MLVNKSPRLVVISGSNQKVNLASPKVAGREIRETLHFHSRDLVSKHCRAETQVVCLKISLATSTSQPIKSYPLKHIDRNITVSAIFPFQLNCILKHPMQQRQGDDWCMILKIRFFFTIFILFLGKFLLKCLICVGEHIRTYASLSFQPGVQIPARMPTH